MKRYFSFFAAIIVLIIIAICVTCLFEDRYADLSNDSIIVVVDDEKITKEDIQKRVLFLEISKETTFEYIDQYFPKEQKEEQYDKNDISTDFDDALKQVVNGAASRIQLKKINREIDYNQAVEFTNAFIDDESIEKTYEITLEILAKKGISKDEYLSLLCDYHYDSLCNAELYEYFQENHYQSDEDTSLNQQFEAYLQALVDKYAAYE